MRSLGAQQQLAFAVLLLLTANGAYTKRIGRQLTEFRSTQGYDTCQVTANVSFQQAALPGDIQLQNAVACDWLSVPIAFS